MNLFQILAVDCNDKLIQFVIDVVRAVFTIIQIAIPIALIVLCTIDMFKAMTSGDEKKTKEAQKKSITRLIYAVVAFLLPYLISLAIGFAGNLLGDEASGNLNNFQTFMACWDGSATTDDAKKCYDVNGTPLPYESEAACKGQNGNNQWK